MKYLVIPMIISLLAAASCRQPSDSAVEGDHGMVLLWQTQHDQLPGATPSSIGDPDGYAAAAPFIHHDYVRVEHRPGHHHRGSRYGHHHAHPHRWAYFPDDIVSRWYAPDLESPNQGTDASEDRP